MRAWVRCNEVIAALLLGCSFDSSGGGTAADDEGEGTGSTTGNPTTSAVTTLPQTTMATASGSGDTTSMPPEATSDDTSTTNPVTPTAGSSSSSTGRDPSTSTGPDMCEMPESFSELIWVQDLPGSEIENMEMFESAVLVKDGEWVTAARSLTAGTGTVDFAFETGCEGDVYVWGLFWDNNGGTTVNADSYWYGIDQGAVVGADIWAYGCSSEAYGWTWHPFRYYEGVPCNEDETPPSLPAGTHSLELRNREDGYINNANNTFNFAAVAAIAISNQENFDPNDEYDPVDGT